MMESKPNNHFGHGFLLGALAGATAYFLFGTKKGKKILKYVTEESIDTISEWGEVATDEESLENLKRIKDSTFVKKSEKLVKEVLDKHHR